MREAIEIKGLSKSYGSAPVIRQLDLGVSWGQALVIVGPNGSGKTTLIKILASLTKPDMGEVRIAGKDAGRMGDWVRRMVGVVAHDPLLYGDLTAYENLKFAGRMFGLDQIDNRIASVVEQLGVTTQLHQKVNSLSQGLRKRLDIARAILHEPRILLMDEPETGLDQDALLLLNTVIANSTNKSAAVVMTTHSIERGLIPGRHLAILFNGRIVFQKALGLSVKTDDLMKAYFRHTRVVL